MLSLVGFVLSLFGGGAQDKVKSSPTLPTDIWDTAGQERFTKMHPSYYHTAHACILVVEFGPSSGILWRGSQCPCCFNKVFDVTRKITYKNLANWYKVNQSVHTCSHAQIIPFLILFYLYYFYIFLQELREYRPHIPCIVVANKIDGWCKWKHDSEFTNLPFQIVDYSVTQKSFAFAKKHELPFYFVSAADGTNVVKVACSSHISDKHQRR